MKIKLDYKMKYLTRIYFILIFEFYYITVAKFEDDIMRYCSICEQHTMCLFPFDDPSVNCKNISNGDLDNEEIAIIISEHNLHRNNIASGQENRGNPGPQSSAKNMMELSWDAELARLSRRWALQCHLQRKDECRDVERFSVWQNVHVLNIDKLETDTTSHHRIPFHVQSWLDDVENFDTAEVGMVDFSSESRGSYIGIAAGKISRIGCGRALYTVETWHETGIPPLSLSSSSLYSSYFSSSPSSSSSLLSSSSSSSSSSSLLSMLKDGTETSGENNYTNVSVGNHVEVLVCNYGPIDRSTPRHLYDVGTPGYCPMGFTNSRRYEYLCTKSMEKSANEDWLDQNKQSSSTGILQSKRISFLFYILYQSFFFSIVQNFK